MRELLNNKYVDNYFMDITYQIIPKKHKPYKLLTLTYVNKNTNTTHLCCLVGLIYEDYLSIYYALKYIHNFFNFNPKFLHIDYSKFELKALNQKDLFNAKPIIICCFFHFTQCLFPKLIKYNIIKKK